MDESAKRRERLKAMRREAEQVEVIDSQAPLVPLDRLSNPFDDALATSTAMNDPTTVPRFDYYTDPLSAFSTNKRRNAMNQGPGMKQISSSAAYQMKIQSSPDQSQFGPQSSWRSPITSPLRPPTGSPITGNTAWTTYGNQPGIGVNSPSPHPKHQTHMQYSAYQRPLDYPVGTQGSLRSPVASPFPLPTFTPAWTLIGSQPGYVENLTSPHFVHQLGSSSVRQLGNIPNYSHGRGSSSSSVSSRGSYNWVNGRGGSNCNIGDGKGRSPFVGNRNGAPGSNSGLDRGRRYNYHNNFSDESKARQYYTKSMVEDPWRLLKPVVKDLVPAMTNTNSLDS